MYEDPGEEDEEGDARRGPRLHPDDPLNFFKLSAAPNLLLGTTIDDTSVEKADALLREYCTELIHVRPLFLYARVNA